MSSKIGIAPTDSSSSAMATKWRATADFLRDWIAAALARPEVERWTQEFLTRIRPIVSGEFDPERLSGESLDWFEAALARADVATREGFEDYEVERAVLQELLQSTRTKYVSDGVTLKNYGTFLFGGTVFPQRSVNQPGALSRR
jgi:hypothetical protein